MQLNMDVFLFLETDKIVGFVAWILCGEGHELFLASNKGDVKPLGYT